MTQWFSAANNSVVMSVTEVRAKGLELRFSLALCPPASCLIPCTLVFSL